MRTILITGASSGIGLAAAVELARRGERVFASMRNPANSGALRTALDDAGVEAEVIQLDVTDNGSVTKAVAGVLERAGSIDVLVNNAGVTTVGPLEFTSDEELFQTFDTNVFGVLRTTRAVLPSMRASRRGRIVNISSAAAHPRVGIRLWGPYAASKAALHALSLELLKEVAPLGIEVVLLEGGVSGQTAAWNAPRASAAAFVGGAYAFSERVSAAQIAAATSGEDATPKVAILVADACTVEAPPVRFRPELQSGIDLVNQIPDETFLRLARGDTDPGVYAGLAGFWSLQASLVAAND